MEQAQNKRRKPLLVFLLIVLVVFVGLPLIVTGLSFIGRIAPHSVIPDTFTAYGSIPDPVECAEKLLAHEGLNAFLADPLLSAIAPAVSQLRDSKILQKPLVRFAGKGDLSGAWYADGSYIAAYDAGMLSPILRLAPSFAGRLTVPGLYYVQSGRNSRFEYRIKDSQTLFIAPYRNLLVVTNDSDLLESVLAGTSRSGDGRDESKKNFASRDFDAGFLVASDALLAGMAASDPAVLSVTEKLVFPERTELAVRISEKKLDISLSLRLSSTSPELETLLRRDSPVPSILSALPGATQYSTLLSAGNFEELLMASGAASGPVLVDTLSKADSSSRMFLGIGLDELLYSWTGQEMAVFALEGRPLPVLAVRVADEKKRKDVFDKLSSSLALTEDSSVVLDGIRISQIRLPSFLNAIMKLSQIQVPAPYYIVEDGVVYFSDSPENLLVTVKSVRKNSILIKTDLWKNLSEGSPDRSSFSVFYSLDRSVPFFLKGNSAVNRILAFYRQGLARLSFRDGLMSVSLSVVSGPGKGIAALSGYPLDLSGKAGKKVDGILFGKKGESRILVVIGGNTVISLDPASGKRYVFEGESALWCIPDPGLKAKNASDPALWIVTSRGQVHLVNGNLESVAPFPVATGNRPSCEPSAFGGTLYIPDVDGSLYTVDALGKTGTLSLPFTDILRAPLTFISAGKNVTMAAYPKSFFGQLWLTDLAGTVRSGWPLPVSGIAFGSPLLISKDNSFLAAFMTQAGELSLYTAEGLAVSPFPLQLPGVFFSQPVFDGTFLWAVSAAGTLFQISLEGAVLSALIPGFSAEEGSVTFYDIDGDKVSEIFVSGDGNALYGYNRHFALLDGFPLPVSGTPFFGDLNGDGKTECAGAGLDNRLYGWQFR